MSSVREKLFGNRPTPANDTQDLSGRYQPDNETSEARDGSSRGGYGRMRGGDAMPESQRVASTFDSIGRRNEELRAKLDAVEFSFRNIEAIRGQFHDTLIPIDQTLVEIEHTKVAHAEAERRLSTLTTAHGRLKSDHAALTLERNAFALRQDELSARLNDLERTVTAAEASSSEARAALAERTAKLERVERELEDNRRCLQTASVQLPAMRAEFSAKEKRLQEVEQQRASLHDQNDLLTQENSSVRARIEEFVANASKLNRQLSELESQRDDTNRRLEELELSLSHETAAHAKLKTAHLDAAEAHRLSATNLKEQLGAMSARSEAAERLLADARAALLERDAAIRSYEQHAIEHSLAMKSSEAALSDLEKNVTSMRAMHAEVDVARAAASERSMFLAKSLEDKDNALQRAEQRAETLEAKFAEQYTAALGERELYEDKIAKLKEQLEAETAARAFSEGALQSARQERWLSDQKAFANEVLTLDSSSLRVRNA
jgi:chromosome segregation ATPase